nr:glucose dehydrogenase [FAD, quinone]-like [Rhipicephalus microplus]
MEDAFAQVPLFAPLLIGDKFDWKYLPEQQENACLSMKDQRCPWARGKAMGGSSAINFMFYVRGNRRDYDIWRDKFGAYGWSYDDVLPHFKNIETSRVPDHDGQVLFDGKRAFGIRFANKRKVYEVNATREVLISAGAVASPQLLLLSGIGPRHDLEKLQIPVIRDLPVGENLQDHMHVDGIVGTLRRPTGLNLFRLSTVTDYAYKRSGPLSIPASIEALAFVSTSFVNESLEFPDAEIALQSLPSSALPLECYFASMGLRKDAFVSPLLKTTPLNRSWEARLTELNMGSQLATNDLARQANVYNQYYLPNRGRHGFALAPVMNRPKSRGYVKLRTTDPFDKPIIDPKYLTHPDDVKAAVEGVKIALRLMKSDAMRAVGAKPWNIPFKWCLSEGSVWSDPYLTCLVRHLAHTTWHACCTCPMGMDEKAVLDPDLRVRGVKNLRVVDASVMPTIVSGNLNAPTMMIADKAAAMIIQDNL